MLQATPAYAAAPALSVKDVRITETDSGLATANVRVVLSKPAAARVTAEYTTRNGTALASSDYVRQSGLVVIPRGRQGVTIKVTIRGDELDEPNEYFRFRIAQPIHATIADPVGLVRIVDNDDAPYLSAGDVTVTEADSGVTVAKFPVTLSEVSGRVVRVAYTVMAGTATADVDFSMPDLTGTLEFQPGTTSRSVGVVVLGDLLDEADETFHLYLTSPVNAYVADYHAVGTIVDDDAGALTIGDVTVVEGQNATFTVRLSRAISHAVSFYYYTSNGTASSSTDYTYTSGYGYIGAGSTSTTLTVPTVNDTVFESAETFSVTLSSPQNAGIADGHGVGTITDNDGPSLHVEDVTVTEGQTAYFPVRLSNALSSKVTFSYQTVSGTAGSADYSHRSGTATIAAGSTSTTIAVPTSQDGIDEANEYFYLNIWGASSNVVINDAYGQATILDDDVPAVTIGSVSRNEGWQTDSGWMNFPVYLSSPSSKTVTVRWATTSVGGTSQAAAGEDYTAVPDGSVTFAPGVTQATVSVKIVGDLVKEENEVFGVYLYNPANAVLGNPSVGTGTILNDDVVGTDEGYAKAEPLGTVVGDGKVETSTPPWSDKIDLNDVDWFKFTVTESDLSKDNLSALVQLDVKTPTQTTGDLDLVVYKTDGTTIVGSGTEPGTADEKVGVTVADTEATDTTVFYVKVFGKAGLSTVQLNSYTLTVTGNPVT